MTGRHAPKRRRPTDPRRLGGDIAGPGGPHDTDGVVVDTTNAVLLDNTTVALVGVQRGGESDEVAVALMLEGRVNKTPDRVRVLFMTNADGVAALAADLLGLAKRAERNGAPELAAELRTRLGERWDEMPK
jgi:hypothetical protein